VKREKEKAKADYVDRLWALAYNSPPGRAIEPAAFLMGLAQPYPAALRLFFSAPKSLLTESVGRPVAGARCPAQAVFSI
jgi:hypothetical protein